MPALMGQKDIRYLKSAWGPAHGRIQNGPFPIENKFFSLAAKRRCPISDFERLRLSERKDIWEKRTYTEKKEGWKRQYVQG